MTARWTELLEQLDALEVPDGARTETVVREFGKDGRLASASIAVKVYAEEKPDPAEPPRPGGYL